MQAFRRIREIAGHSDVVLEEIAPGPKVQSDADVLRWIQDNASLIYHASATCELVFLLCQRCETSANFVSPSPGP